MGAVSLPAPEAQATDCVRVHPKEPRLTTRKRRDTCVVLSGYWGVGALQVAEVRDGVTGYRVLRPFSFVRETNPSLGWPSHAALDTVLVDIGWFSESDLPASPVRTSAGDPLFEEPVLTTGTVRAAPQVTDEVWEILSEVLAEPDTYPYGSKLTGVVLQQR